MASTHLRPSRAAACLFALLGALPAIPAGAASAPAVAPVDPPSLSIGDVTITEGQAGDKVAKFVVALSAPAPQNVFFDIETSQVNAVGNDDFRHAYGTGVVSAGESAGEVQIVIFGDTVLETDETFEVRIPSAQGATVVDGLAIGTILNDDAGPSPQLLVSNTWVAEGNSGSRAAVLTVQLSQPAASDVSFSAATANGTASSGSDYSAVSLANQVIPAGQLTKDIQVAVSGDTSAERDETFTLSLSNVIGAGVARAQGTGTIGNDDSVSPVKIQVSDAYVQERESGPQEATFFVTLSQPAASTVSFDLRTEDGSATAGSDYTAVSHTGQTIPAGQTSKMFKVFVNGDTLDEPEEHFLMVLSNVTNAAIEYADPHGVGVIPNDDATLSIGDVTQLEGSSGSSTGFLFPVTLSAPLANSFIFQVETVDGTATASSGDFGGRSGSNWTFPAGQTSVNVIVHVQGDTTLEPDETFTVRISGGGLPIADNEGLGTILNDDAPPIPSLYFNDASIVEGNAGSKSLDFVVTFSEAALNPVSFDLYTVNGSAVGGSDFIAIAPTRVTIPAGVTSHVISVTILGDTAIEVDETFFLEAQNFTDCTSSHNIAIGTITNDDVAVVPTIYIGDATVTETDAGQEIMLPITLSAPPTNGVGFYLYTLDGTAVAGSDFVASELRTDLFPGTTNAFVTITLKGDLLAESTETFQVFLGGLSGATIGDVFATVTVLDDDPVPTGLSIDDVSVREFDFGSPEATFTVTLNPASASPVSFDIATGNGTAVPGADYTSKSLVGQVMPPGMTSYTFTVLVGSDTEIESDETFTVNLDNVVGAVVADPQALGTIRNDDVATLSVDSLSLAEGNAGVQTASFVVRLSRPMPAPVRFDIATIGGTATAGTDYLAAAQASRTIDAGRTQARFDVVVNGDSLNEANETFQVALTNVLGALAGPPATGTIENDDGAAPTAIHAIQGRGASSPLAGKDVATEGVVTAVTAHGFFLQSPEGRQDGDAATSEGLVVASPVQSVARGDRVRAEGRVQEALIGDADGQGTQTQLVASKLTTLARGAALPRAAPLVAGRAGYEPLEGMRVFAPALRVVAPSGGTIDDTTGAVHSDGRFRVVPDGGATPLRVDSLGQRGASALSADVGDRYTGLAGVLGYGEGAFALLPDPAVDYSVVSGANPQPVSEAAPDEASIGYLPLRRFYDAHRDGDEPVPTAAAYAIRLAKTANVICAYLRNPAILGITGIESQAAADDLAAAVNSQAGNALFPGSCAGDPRYVAILGPAGADGLRSGFLVSTEEVRHGVSRVAVHAATPLPGTETLLQRDGRRVPLFASAPLLLEARWNAPTGETLGLAVVASALSPGDARDTHQARGDTVTRMSAVRRQVAAWRAARPASDPVLLGELGALLGVSAGPAAATEVARINADFGEDNAGDPGVPMRVSEADPSVLRLPVR